MKVEISTNHLKASKMKLQRQHFLRMVLFAIMTLAPFVSVSAEQFIGNITLKQGERKTLSLSSAYQSIMTSYGIGSPSWLSDNTNICSVSSRTKVSCDIYGSSVGLTYVHFKGEYWSGTVITEYTCYWTISVEANGGGNGGGGTTPSSDDEYTLPEESWGVFGNYDFSWYNKNQTEFTISTNKELAGMAYLVNNKYADFEGKTIKLANDIDISGKKWIPIGNSDNPFKGNLYGQDFTISGLSAENGLIGIMYGSTITGLTVQGYIFVNEPKSGSSFYFTMFIGGIASKASNSKIEKCHSNININYRRTYSHGNSDCPENIYIGGLLGYGGGPHQTPVTISYCTYNGEIKCKMYGEHAYIGGIIGDAYGCKIEYCENNAPMISVESERYPPTSEHQNIYLSGINGQSYSNNDIVCCRSICSFSVKHTASLDRYYPNIILRGIGYGKSVNCYSITPSITLSATYSCQPSYSGIGGQQVIANYSNSDVNIQTTLNVMQSNSGSTAFSSAQMRTPAFLQELNMYPMLEMDGPVWTQDEGGYPYIAKLHEASGISSVFVDKAQDDKNIYTLSGQRQTSPKKGINIVGGKKVVVR